MELTSLNPMVLKFGKASLYTPILDFYKEQQSTHACNVEQFAGGYGGWSFADRCLQQQGFHRIAANRTIAIESDLPAAVQFALNHDFVMVGSPKDLPPGFLSEHPESTISVCDIQDHEWQTQLAQLTIEQWRISAPCQSWSFAGKQDGFSCENGMHMAHSIAQTRIHRPKTILSEQVSGFPNHCHVRIAKRLFEWAGYVEVGSGVFDYADVGPVRESRCLSLFVRHDVIATGLSLQPWPSVATARPSQWDAMFPLTHVEAKKVCIESSRLG